MTQMYSQQLGQQRDALKYHNLYRAQAIEIQSRMDKVLKDSSLPEDVESLRYNDLLQDCKFTMLRSTQSTHPLLNLPVHKNAFIIRTTSSLSTSTLTINRKISSSLRQNIIRDLALVQDIPSITSRSQRYTPSSALRYLAPPESISRPTDTPLISFSEEERK